MNELMVLKKPTNLENPIVEHVETEEVLSSSADHFICANTIPISFEEIKNKSIIPVFSKDNESTISHTEFISVAGEVIQQFFKHEQILKPAIRVSHPVKGRVPEAMGKPANQLREDEKTIYYERMAFVFEIPTITNTVNGNQLNLTIGGVRAYNTENLYNRKTEERFKVFIGFQNKVCTNLCISTDGINQELKVRSLSELAMGISNLVSDYNAFRHIHNISKLSQFSFSEKQFAQLIGRARMYQFLPARLKQAIPPVPISDTQISAVAREYYKDISFCRNSNGTINLWKFYNLLTGANKSSYIDTFLGRSVGCYQFVCSLAESLVNHNDSWYLS